MFLLSHWIVYNLGINNFSTYTCNFQIFSLVFIIPKMMEVDIHSIPTHKLHYNTSSSVSEYTN